MKQEKIATESKKNAARGPQMTMRRRRSGYITAFLLFLAVEIWIALFVHDSFVRPYLGDVFVVIVVYCFVRIFVPVCCRLLPLYVFFFAAGVEFLQYFRLVERLGLAGNRFLRILLGSVFDWKDIVCYAVGSVLLCGWEIMIWNISRERKKYCKTPSGVS